MVNSERDYAAFDILDDNRVGADPGMRPDFDGPQDLGAGTNIDMISDPGNAGAISVADRNLLKDQAIHADLGVRMDHDAVGMWNEKASADVAVQGDVGTGDGTPKSMA